jgi:hypothetical protein
MGRRVTEGSGLHPAKTGLFGPLMWSQGFDGSASGGFEVGFTLFTPRFLCRGGCETGSE